MTSGKPQTTPPPDREGGSSGLSRVLIALAAAFIAIGLAATAFLLWGKGAPRADASARRLRPGAAAEASSAASLPPPSVGGDSDRAESRRPADFQKLKGRWLREDGDYVLEIRQVAAGGKMEAGYFNPRPIHVARAEAAAKATALEVFVELRDQGYPGCTYRLTYHPGRDQLEGTYYQAAQGSNYEVVFVRMK